MSSVVARDIRAGYREREVLRGIDLIVRAGELVALVAGLHPRPVPIETTLRRAGI